MKVFISIICLLTIVAALYTISAGPTLAVETGLEQTAQQAGLQSESISVVIGRVIKVVLTFLGVVLLIVLIYAGVLWMTAGGDETQVKKAKGWILNGMIGLLIILAAYALTDFVVRRIVEATGGHHSAHGLK